LIEVKIEVGVEVCSKEEGKIVVVVLMFFFAYPL
jgi:hypothetical protein